MSGSVSAGLYRHFKGKLYRVIDTVTHSETDEVMVVYQALYGEKGLWVRPLAMFDEMITRQGKKQRRFQRCDEQTVCLETAVLNVKAGQSVEFEAAFAQAQKIIAGARGYISHELRRCEEHSNQYMLLVYWESLEHHTQGFRESDAYQRWSDLLHHFYHPHPEVEHYSKPLRL